MSDIFAIELGVQATCAVTGFKGLVTARLEYDTGCLQYQVTPKVLKNEIKKSEWIDEIHLLASVTKPKKTQKRKGGFHPDPPARSHP